MQQLLFDRIILYIYIYNYTYISLYVDIKMQLWHHVVIQCHNQTSPANPTAPIEGLIGTSSIHWWFSIAMLDYQMGMRYWPGVSNQFNGIEWDVIQRRLNMRYTGIYPPLVSKTCQGGKPNCQCHKPPISWWFQSDLSYFRSYWRWVSNIMGNTANKPGIVYKHWPATRMNIC